MKPTWSEALRLCLARAATFGVEKVPRREAFQRVLAEDLCADRDYPAADLGTMDGYALAETRLDSYLVDGENAPGSGARAALKPGSARRIFTGAELPEGATRVVPQENVRREGDRIVVTEWPDTLFVRPRGREAREGGVVLRAGTRIGSVEFSMMATVGCREVVVTRQPKLFRLATGDEIVSPDEPLPAGKIRDSNGDLIEGLLRNIGVSVSRTGRASDDESLVSKMVNAFAEDAEFLLISGGASVGDHDFVRPALKAAGFEFVVEGINLRPGKPVAIGHRDGKWAVALPGNPISHLVVMRLLVLPLLRACLGEKNAEPQLIRGILDAPLETETNTRDTFWPATVSLRDGDLHAQPGRFLSSGDLLGATDINGFISLPAEKAIPAAGELVYLLPLAANFP